MNLHVVLYLCLRHIIKNTKRTFLYYYEVIPTETNINGTTLLRTTPVPYKISRNEGVTSLERTTVLQYLLIDTTTDEWTGP